MLASFLAASAASVQLAGGLYRSKSWSNSRTQGTCEPSRHPERSQTAAYGGDLLQPWCGIMPRLQGWHDIAAVDSRDEWRARQKPAFSTVWKMSGKGIFHFTNQGCTSKAPEAAVGKKRTVALLGNLAEDAATLLSDGKVILVNDSRSAKPPEKPETRN